jgi:hypothetical protein
MSPVRALLGFSFVRALLGFFQILIFRFQEGPKKMRRPRVVVVGGSFAGLCCVRHLRKHNFDVTLVEPKEYFEYTPGVLHLLAGSKGDLVSPLGAMALRSGAARVVHGDFIGVDTVSKEIAVLPLHGDATENGDPLLLPYDAAIICAGTPYASPIRQDWRNKNLQPPSMANRLSEIEQYTERLRNASHVIVAGGGLVGVELAAELSIRLQGVIQQVTLVSRSPLLITLPAPAGRHALAWFKKRNNVKLFIEDEIVSCDSASPADGGLYMTKSGQQLRADLYIDCTGSRFAIASSSPPPSFPQKSAKLSSGGADGLLWPFNARGLINVDEHFRAADVDAGTALFAAGDVVEHSKGEGVGFAASTSLAPFGALMARPTVRNAHLAESQAELVAYNVASVLRAGRSGPAARPPLLHAYPRDVFGTSLCPLLSCVSLGTILCWWTESPTFSLTHPATDASPRSAKRHRGFQRLGARRAFLREDGRICQVSC